MAKLLWMDDDGTLISLLTGNVTRDEGGLHVEVIGEEELAAEDDTLQVTLSEVPTENAGGITLYALGGAVRKYALRICTRRPNGTLYCR